MVMVTFDLVCLRFVAFVELVFVEITLDFLLSLKSPFRPLHTLCTKGGEVDSAVQAFACVSVIEAEAHFIFTESSKGDPHPLQAAWSCEHFANDLDIVCVVVKQFLLCYVRRRCEAGRGEGGGKGLNKKDKKIDDQTISINDRNTERKMIVIT